MTGVLLSAVLLAASAAAPAAAPTAGQLDASPALFSVLAAINAAGYDAELDSPSNHPLRFAVRRELASLQVPSLGKLRQFFDAHRQKDWTAELSQYVSFALSVDGPPNFKYRFLAHQIPPDVRALEGFDALMRRFYKEAGLEALWKKAQPAFDEVIAQYQQPAARALLEVNAYLRTPSSGYLGRRFQIYVDLLGAPHQVHTRNYIDDYYVVLTPSPEPRAEEVRHAYLHYLLDPLVGRYSEQLNKKKPLIDYALGSPLLEEHYKQDFLLLATECLIKAVEARLDRKPALVGQALREGFILTPYFAESLPAYERQEQALRFYFGDLAEGIDLHKEAQRLDNVEFASQRAVRAVKPTPAAPPPEPTAAEKSLEEAEQYYAGRELEKASQAYRRVLELKPEPRLRARGYYGLARIAVLQKDPEAAEKLFQSALESGPDPPTQAWAYVYLGRLADAAGQRAEAVAHYRAAQAVAGAPAEARSAAEKGLQEAFRKPAPPP